MDKKTKPYGPISVVEINEEMDRVAKLPRLEVICLMPWACPIHGKKKKS